MIKQPELGKTISDYRKAKGLTQEDLVEKCNLSVRTLQRIESGEVTPRIVTVKLIFEALELDYYNYFKPDSGEKGIVTLFNFKDNTFKKVSVVTLTAFVIAFTLTILYQYKKPKNIVKNENIFAEKNIMKDSVDLINPIINGQYSGWNNEDELIARDISCMIDDVYFISPLIKLNKKTREFRTPCVTGTISTDKVIITSMRCEPTKRIVSKIVFEGDKYIYTEGAKLVFSEKESINAYEIIILRN
ncbi:hypothetical protein GCM10011416_24160 [Polaribacter pacificus]|uniref:HTH cro/C1-type domain-containing protein n=1 Tax=Polaribacter pacificus TaxID=1775173 RepID=A0A917MFK5_9FLAO|nr:helix-turn-helix transcriptional regulator [Polaribacter pacificus]GGH04250.1 hypothetical protein GCM10011416_24160 [Polaribacter pacificus]